MLFMHVQGYVPWVWDARICFISMLETACGVGYTPRSLSVIAAWCYIVNFCVCAIRCAGNDLTLRGVHIVSTQALRACDIYMVPPP